MLVVNPNVMPYIRLLRWPTHIGVGFEWPAFVQGFLDRRIQPVVVDSVRVRNLVHSAEGDPDSLVTVLEFNDEASIPGEPDHVDLLELQSSLSKSGTFFIWTCTCGYAGCAGMERGVQVDHSDGKTRWSDLDRKRMFEFQTQTLIDAFEMARIEGKNLLTVRPSLSVVPEKNLTAYTNAKWADGPQ